MRRFVKLPSGHYINVERIDSWHATFDYTHGSYAVEFIMSSGKYIHEWMNEYQLRDFTCIVMNEEIEG